MQGELRFIEAPPVSTRLIPKKVIEVETHEANKPVTKRKIPTGGYYQKRNRIGWSTIEVFTQDTDYGLALDWYCRDDLSDVIFPALQGDGATQKIQIAGEFRPSLSKEDISEICRLYQILRPHFSSFQAIHSFKIENNKLTETLLLYLIDKSEGREVELEDWQREVVRIKREKQSTTKQ
jgi:hypothetical protein